MPYRYKLVIEYDGTNLLGWQKQLDGPSVQEHIQKAFYGFLQQDVEVYGSGRTDAGVHAIGQVAHAEIDKEIDCYRLAQALNAHLRLLKAPVSILSTQRVNEDFHARFSATSRSYIYKITNRKSPLILQKNKSWWVSVDLDIKKMQEGANHLLGSHDFSSFRATKCQANSPMRSIDIIKITQNGEDISVYIKAKSFLHHQVRNIVGTLKLVGDGHLKPQDIKTILEQKDRTKAGATAPACGLYLYQIDYD